MRSGSVTCACSRWICLSHRVIAAVVESVSVRDLRNRGGGVLDRLERGECVIMTRDGRAVAELRPLPRRSARPVELIERRKGCNALTPTRCDVTSTPSSIQRCDP